MLRGLCMLAAGCLASVVHSPAAGSPPKTLYAFCKQTNCADGALPQFGVVEGPDETLYGVTAAGGTANEGVVFALVPRAKTYKYERLYTFCQLTNCADGSAPGSNLFLDSSGNLYGTTLSGGTNGDGTAFELEKNKTGWKILTLYNFCSQTSCLDGSGPLGGLSYQASAPGKPYDGTSPLYGTTTEGGTPDKGVVYELTKQSGATERKEAVLYSFCSEMNCADGNGPFGVIADARGNLYGTTVNGGQNSEGTVYAVSPSLKEETVLYSFCPAASCADGALPRGPLTMDEKGNLYGTTSSGGEFGQGAVFKIIHDGLFNSESVLHSFCALSNCTDGTTPYSSVILGANGILYGTTEEGGAYSVNSDCDGGCGTVFRLRGSAYAVLHSFCKANLPDCSDGAEPDLGPLLLTAEGNLVGTAREGGKHGQGVVFQIAP